MGCSAPLDGLTDGLVVNINRRSSASKKGLGMIVSIRKTYMKSFTLEGRATRLEFWKFHFFLLLSSTMMLVLAEVWFVFILASVPPWIALQVRRLHDLGRSGWWMLLSIIPYVGVLCLLIAYCLPGSAPANNYGEGEGQRRK
jgi:uncharacterized membrane protein YhaH (DUF805 family)